MSNKDILQRLRDRFASSGNHVIQALCEDAANEIERLRTALDTLSPPDGVGLTRYDKVGNEYDETTFMAAAPNGEWVRYEDAAAALAAEKERADGHEKRADHWQGTARTQEDRAEAAEARCDTLAGALDEAADDMRRIISNIDHDIGIQLVRLDLKAAMNRAQAALATIPAKPET